MTEADWDRVFAVDLKGAWLCVKHVLPVMKAQRAGSIVNIASIHATLTIAGMFPYAAAKSGLVGLTRSLALDCAPLGIRVNAVSPGWTRTHLVEEWFQAQPDPAAAEASVHARASDATHGHAGRNRQRRRLRRVGRSLGHDRRVCGCRLRPGDPIRNVESRQLIRFIRRITSDVH